MKIALIGYGKMGKIIERIALERGHEIVCKIDIDNQNDFESEAFASADVAIEFTAPSVAIANYRKAWEAGVAVVSGTTGWNAKMPEIKAEIEKNNYTLFWASNFSLGVNIFFELNKHLAKIMNNFLAYDAKMTETHHIHKLDAPSGTAVTLAEGILENIERKSALILFKRNRVLQCKHSIKALLLYTLLYLHHFSRGCSLSRRILEGIYHIKSCALECP